MIALACSLSRLRLRVHSWPSPCRCLGTHVLASPRYRDVAIVLSPLMIATALPYPGRTADLVWCHRLSSSSCAHPQSCRLVDLTSAYLPHQLNSSAHVLRPSPCCCCCRCCSWCLCCPVVVALSLSQPDGDLRVAIVASDLGANVEFAPPCFCTHGAVLLLLVPLVPLE